MSSIIMHSSCTSRNYRTFLSPSLIFWVFLSCWSFRIECWTCGLRVHDISHIGLCFLDMAKRVRPVWPATRLTRLKMTRFDLWPVLTCDPFDPTRTWLDPPVLPCLPMMSKLRLRCNFYKIFTYSSLLNMLCILL